MKKSENDKIEDLERVVEAKLVKKDCKKRTKMRVSGAGVKKLQKIIANKAD